MTKRQSILIADNQYLITEALTVIMEKEGTYLLSGIVGALYELDNSLQKQLPDLLIIDPQTIDINEKNDLIKIKSNYPALPILVLTNQVTKTELSGLTKLKIKNILYKNSDKEELFEAIKATIKGKNYYSSEIVDMLIEQDDRKSMPDQAPNLTPAEIDITRLIADGLTTKEIAVKKNISFHTVMAHRKNIFRKLEINNVSELLMYAMKNGLIDTIEYYI
jgi:DNA-binding NarL/FixJ family response regulator